MPDTRTEAIVEPLFAWEGTDRYGQAVRGEAKAAGALLLRAQLRRQGIRVTRVQRRLWAGQRGLSPQHRATFTRQLAAMTKAGLPLLQSLDLLARGLTTPALVQILQQVRHDVATGQALSSAMARHPEIFPSLYCRLLAVGEAAGTMDSTLDRLALGEEKALALRLQIRSALMYPAAVVLVATSVVAVMVAVVVPTFEEVFASFGGELPWATRLVVSASHAVAAWWWLGLAILAAAALGVRALIRSSEALRGRMDALLLRLPVVGDLLLKAVVARWARTLATLCGAGMTLVDALGSVAGVLGNRVFSLATWRIQHEVSTGQRMADSMLRAGVFPPMLLQMASIGEETGALEPMLVRAADFFEAEVELRLKGLFRLFEPALIIFMSGLIGGVVFALYLPMFHLGSIA